MKMEDRYRIGRVVFCPRCLEPSMTPLKTQEEDAVVLEDDTHHVLSADPTFREPADHPIVIHTQALHAVPAPLGKIKSSGRDPILLRAVVHDLARMPSVELDDVKNAIADLFVKCGDLNIGSLSMPLLGTVHGRLDSIQVLDILHSLAPIEGKTLRIALEVSLAQQTRLRDHWSGFRWIRTDEAG
jgi:hypothetical protein